jgi:NAD(P)H dehydrogenase (quinone)
MITLTGVSGNLGRIVIEDLLTRVPATELVAIARTPEKVADLAERGVEVRRGDYDDPASLREAFAGSDVLQFVSGSDVTPGVRQRQHTDVVDAAKAAGVGRVVYTSAIHAQDGPGFLADHGFTENLLRDSGVPHTLLRNTFYEEVLVNPGLKEVVGTGELKAADEGNPVNFATIRDMGLAASRVLTEDGHVGATYEIRGPLWTIEELARTVGEVSGKPAAYRAVPVDELGPLGFVYQLIASGLFSEPSEDLERLLGRPATPLRTAVEAALQD